MITSDFYRIISERRSIRKYKLDEIADDVLARVLNAARIAPSAGNRQPWSFIVVKDDAIKLLLKEAYDKDWFITAPVIIVAVGEASISPYRKDAKDFREIDVSIAFTHLVLAAQAEELGTCWLGAFLAEPVKRILGIPEGFEPIALTPLGYPDEKPDAKPRKKAEEIIHWDKW